MKKIREWLRDYFALCDGNEMEKLVADLADREVNSAVEARKHVNLRIDMMIAWLDDCRPDPGPVAVELEDEGMLRAMGLFPEQES